MKSFNTTAVCIPSKHYMVDLSERVKAIKQMVDAEKYFTINCARQYGKTTTIVALGFALSDQYDVISIDFQDLTSTIFDNESKLTKGLTQLLCDTGAVDQFLVRSAFIQNHRVNHWSWLLQRQSLRRCHCICLRFLGLL